MRKREQITSQFSYQLWDRLRDDIYVQLYSSFNEDIHNKLRDNLWLELQILLYDRTYSYLQNYIGKKQ